MRFRLLTGLALFAICSAAAGAQQPELLWSEDGTRAAFQQTNRQRQKQFYVIDVRSKSRELAFDHQQLALKLGKLVNQDLDAQRLPIDQVRLTDDPSERLVDSRGKTYRWNIDDQSLTLAERSQPSIKLFLPPKFSGASRQRTTVNFDNQLDVEIELLWLDSRGQRQSYGKVKPGQTRDLSTFVGHMWLLVNPDGRPLGCYEAIANDHLVLDQEAIDLVDRRRPDRPTGRRRRGNWMRRSPNSPDGRWQVSIKDDNLWLQPSGNQSADAQPLTDFGKPDNTFANSRRADLPNIVWAPDSSCFLAYQTAPVEDRKVYYIESSPRDQLQPKLQSYNYPKPGDPFPKETLHLFVRGDNDQFERMEVANDQFPDPYDLRLLGMNEAQDAFRLLYNQRGHQVLRLLQIDGRSGEVSVLAENLSDTFVQYSDRGKNYHHFLSDDRLIWASEKSGWNHLYLYDGSGNELQPITQGDWNVKRVVDIDAETQTIWFYAVGIRPDQDPYHEHFCRVQTDGTGLTILTAGDGTHEVEFQQDGKYLLDTWSRVDLAPVSELRDAKSGELIAELSRQDTAAKFGDRPLTARFSAPGRDGETEIWGILHFPKDFDPDKSYPVVEQIYAGPHDHHVPKSFRSRYGAHRIADAGMIVVQIDGMGTAWRSKAFHDVCYKNLRDAGFPDRIAWMKAAAEKYPQMDLSRVGIFGGSAGGQNAMAALLWHHDFYKVAVADCGCHDNRMDKRWWNEQWMGYPVDDSYRENSNMENAHLLQGKLMLLVGEKDQNVDPASTTQVVDRLIKANKDFEFVLVPGVGHGSASHPWAARKQLEFLKRHLKVD